MAKKSVPISFDKSRSRVNCHTHVNVQMVEWFSADLKINISYFHHKGRKQKIAKKITQVTKITRVNFLLDINTWPRAL